ncbi:MAG: hypothetical protein ABIG68_07600 [Acidobacteriota bacterium]
MLDIVPTHFGVGPGGGLYQYQPVAACAAFGRSGDTRRKQF